MKNNFYNMELDVKIADKIKSILIKKNKTIAVAESVTGGFLQAAFTQVKDASQFFHGGITAYNLGQKSKHLNINTIHAEACNCVSEDIATQMALSVTTTFCSHYGIAITGYAAKMPEKNINRTFAYCALALEKKLLFTSKLLPSPGIAEGMDIQIFYVNQTLQKILKKITKL